MIVEERKEERMLRAAPFFEPMLRAMLVAAPKQGGG
jgi:hypothetical protein